VAGLESVNNTYLDKHKKFRIDSKKLATVFLIAAFIVAIVVFWWLKLVGITITGEAFCGMDEHTHSEDCYISELVCGFDEIESGTLPSEETKAETTVEISDTGAFEFVEDENEKADEYSETDSTTENITTKASHTHTDECYSKTMVCTKSEHTHTQKCFPDKMADVETVGDWLDTLEGVEITNNIPENLIAVAMTQLDYEESNNNFEYDSDGNKNGYTRYGEWYGNPYGKWNTMFVSFCLHYTNINNDSELKASGAEALRIAWNNRNVYSSADAYTPVRGDIVFLDNDKDGTADATAIIIAPGETVHVVIMGDSNNKVETLSINASESIMGYGLTSQLSFAKDTEHELNKQDEETTEPTTVPEETTEQMPPLMMMSSAPKANITYINDLTTVVKAVNIKTLEGEIIDSNSTIYLGQTYIITMEFAEDNTGDEWIQFRHDEDHHLHYQIPENIHCEPFTEWHPITAKTEDGTIEDVGKYFIREDGLLIVVFEDDPETGECFGAKYSNVDFTIEFNATVADTQSGTSTEVVFNDEIKVELNIDGGAGMTVNKTHGEYDEDNHTMDYTIKVEATHGVVKDLVIDDQIWENHYTLRDTIVVTDLEGNILDPQPVVSDHPSHNSGANEGFRISGFPDFSAGEGFLITYKTKIYDELLVNETVDMWNGLDSNGKNSNGENIYVWSEDWIKVELEKMEKDGRQTVLEDQNGNQISVVEWEVVIKKDNHNLQGTVIIDTLGEGLSYYQGQPITVKHYDEWGNRLNDIYIDWNDVTVNGNTMEFALPDGYQFDIIYYTEYEKLGTDDTHSYTNEVKATINGKEETAGGTADVVGFIPYVNKSARGDDGEYVYFTIEADVPGVIKDWGGFLLTDQAAFWGYNGNDEGYLYVENIPEDLVITAVTDSGRTINFTPYVTGGPTENTYILIYPAEGNQYHSFNIFFNTSSPDSDSSKWILDEDSKLIVTYKIPFDSKTGVEWTGELKGDKTLEDVLLEKYSLSNAAYLNYTDVIKTTGASTYKYSPMITKKSSVNDDGTVDYTVTFYNTIPGTEGPLGYLTLAKSIVFADTFDEKLEYVDGSLSVDCYSPWSENTLFNTYVFGGSVSGNTINVSSTDLVYSKTNESLDAEMVSWLRDWMKTYQVYCSEIAGGKHVFTYKLKLKDEYLNSTEENKYKLDNTAELKWDDDNSSGPVTDTVEIKTGLLDKHAVQKDNKLLFDIHINRNALDILKGADTITIEDTMTHNLSVYWDTIKLLYEDKQAGEWIDFDSAESRYKYTVTYDQTSNKLTFTLPDSLHIRIDYTTLITESGHVSVNNAVKVDGKASVTDIIDATFKVEQHSGGASGAMHEITLIKQDGDTDVRLSDVQFHLYGPMGDPYATLPEGAEWTVISDSGKTLNYIGSYTTGSDGTVNIQTQYLTIGGPYALVEAVPPEGYMPLQKPVYFYFYEPDPNGIIQTVTTLIAVENYTYGFVFPETGGTGTLPLAIIGFAMTAFPILYSTIRRKRERRLT
jgi:fimbrial isopeptide formation D2 family protein/LPXTG-motif cell wall-anchored protein